MNLFYRRPLLLALSVFILTAAVSSKITGLLSCFCIITSALTTIVLLFLTVAILMKSRFVKVLFNTFICLFFCFTALISSHIFFNKTLAVAESFFGEARIIARIDTCEYKANYTSVYIAKLCKITDNTENFYIELASNGPSELQRGDIVSTVATFYPFSENNYGFNERNTNISNNILAYAEFENAEIIGREERTLKYFFSDMRDSISDRIGNDADSSGMIKALLIGDRSDLESGTALNYRRMGISHILSISGTHFTILLGMIAVILSSMGLGKKSVYFLLIPIALFYMGLTGFSESVCRAGIMAIISYSAFLLGRNKDAYTALFVSVTVILLISPSAVLSISLWLSFTATFAILILNELFDGLKKLFLKLKFFGKFLFAIITSILISTFISIMTLPLVASVFGEISLISPVANILVVPLFTVFMYISPFYILFPCLPLARICDAIYFVINCLTDYICSVDNLLVSLKHSFVVPISVVCMAFMLLLIALPLRHRKLILLPPLVCVMILTVAICTFNYVRYDQTDIVYFTEGESDGIVITSQNKTMCIDISTGASSPAYRAEYIAEQCYSPEIAAYLFTHYHSRHVSMFAKLCSRTHVQTVYLPNTNNADSAAYMHSIADTAEERGIDVIWFNYNEPTSFFGSELTVFEPIYISRSTHPVINLQIASNNYEVLYLGSSFSETNFDYASLADGAEYILFGQHNPVPKKRFYVSTNATAVFGSDKQAQLFDGNNFDTVLSKNGCYEILLH